MSLSLENRAFYSTLLKLAIPITAQELVNSGLNFIAELIIYQLGEFVAAVVLARFFSQKWINNLDQQPVLVD